MWEDTNALSLVAASALKLVWVGGFSSMVCFDAGTLMCLQEQKKKMTYKLALDYLAKHDFSNLTQTNSDVSRLERSCAEVLLARLTKVRH